MKCFEEIYEQYVTTVYKICLLYLKKPYDSEEAVQEVFIKYLRYLPTFENNDHEKRWFIKTTTNTCKNILKSSWFQKIVFLDNIPEPSMEYINDDTLVEVLKLPNKYKSTVYLFYYEGYTTDEIAQMLDMKPSTVRSNLSRARKLLKVNLEESIDEI